MVAGTEKAGEWLKLTADGEPSQEHVDLGLELAKEIIALKGLRAGKVVAAVNYWTHNDFASGRTFGLEVATRMSAFTIEKFAEKRRSIRKSDAPTNWKWLDVQTFGHADIGVDYDTRQRVRYDKEDRRLYRMLGKDIDHPLQGLSILLGLGTLARHAAQDPTEYNLFTDLRFGKATSWPFIPEPHY